MPTILLSVYSIHRDPLLVRADSQRGIAVITDALCRVLDHVQDMQCVLYEIYVQRKLVCVPDARWQQDKRGVQGVYIAHVRVRAQPVEITLLL